ncbi:hypothetical protein EHS25_005093 [Saitozyma podzolica]|uniref:Uncharacterized protein n=1 Tax=Saitozyma podzolica TaxID=1890683 RepID=A0A427Y2C1_9TREE|nr:hypothetical protein EHS25_005093 [Saitozyma podzolica]
MSSRLAPPSGPPPRYAAVVSKVYPYSLRPVLIFTSFLGFLWAIVMGVNSIRNRSNSGETNTQKMFDLVNAILYFVVAGIEVFGIVVGVLQSLPLARVLAITAPLAVLANFAAQLIHVWTLIDQCVGVTGGTTISNGNGGTEVVSNAQATNWCMSAWNQGTWTVFAWLIVTGVLSILFAMIAIAYYRQVLDPSSVRTRVQAQSQAFQMQPGQYQPPPQTQQGWMVPPYPGPPANGVNGPGFEKSDYHPDAPWAQGTEPLGYAPPSGPPPGVSSRGIEPNAEEDEAWERARTQGVTAHLTGHAPPPQFESSRATGATGYALSNEEEDEAWERARTTGPTAHLTGNANAKGREGEV